MVRSISSGKSASFPLVGLASAEYHTAGAEINGRRKNFATLCRNTYRLWCKFRETFKMAILSEARKRTCRDYNHPQRTCEWIVQADTKVLEQLDSNKSCRTRDTY